MEDFLGFVITGHIDHGKSTLIGRLLYDTDSLPEGKIEEVKKTCEMLGRQMEFAYVIDHLREERENEMTIDTAQSFFTSKGRQYVIIDAPGHKEFIKNMVTGASQADAAVLIVDMTEGLQEQTRRHAYVLSMLGLSQVVVVLNKMDKVGYSQQKFKELKEKVIEFLARLKITPSYVLPISAMTGENVAKPSENLSWHKGPALLDVLHEFKPRKSLIEKAMRMPVQDVYDLDGRILAVGRVESGVLETGEFKAAPRQEKVEVGKVEEFKSSKGKAEAGTNAGFEDKAGLKRGEVVYSGKAPFSSREMEGSVFWLGFQPLKKGETLACRIATQEAIVTVKEIKNRMNSSTLEVIQEDAEKLEGTEVGEVLLSSETPIVYDLFNNIPPMGRFVLVRNGLVEGGGIIAKAVE